MVLETNIAEHHYELELGKEFLDMRPKYDPQEKKLLKSISSSLKTCFGKDTVKMIKQAIK